MFKKILHTADWHVRDKDIEEILKCTSFLIETARQEKVNLIVIAADIFDSRDIKLDCPSARLAIRSISELADIAPVVIPLGTASHDGTAPEVLKYAKGKHDIIVASTPDQAHFYGGAVVTLIPQPTKQFFQTQSDIATSNVEITQAMNGLFMGMGARAAEYPDAPHILVGHWNVAGSKLSTGQVLIGHEIDIPFDSMMLADPDLICLGHIHLPQQIGDRAFYSGSLYPLTWGEMEAKGFYIHTLDGKKLVESRFIETPTRKLIRFNFDLTDEFADYLSLNDRLLKENYEEAVKGAFVRMDVTVWQDKASEIDKEATKEYCVSAGALDVDIRIIRVPRQTVRSESVLKVESLRDKLVAMAAIKEETVPESILTKADDLEVGPSEDVIRRAA